MTDRILSTTPAHGRRLVALAGPPASGKSTLSLELADRLTTAGSSSVAVLMDGFHLDNRILVSRGLLDRKGAPETFDVRGVNRLVEALAEGGEVYYPLFDRAQDIAIAGAGVVLAECETVVVEGNYLLHDAEDRRDLVKWWDVSIRLVVPEPELEQRLMERWLAHGLTRGQARNRARRKDITNARLVTQTALEADVLVRL